MGDSIMDQVRCSNLLEILCKTTIKEPPVIMIHIINEQGQKETIPASNSLNEKVNRNVTVDLEWYKEHGYCSADEFFSKMCIKYNIQAMKDGE